MATRTTSVPLADGPPLDAAALDAASAELRGRFSGAIVDRYLDRVPRVGRDVLIATGAALAGEVILGDDVSVWYGAVLRGDLAPVTIGDRSNVQDGAVLHVGDDSPCTVGRDVVVGHRAVLHGCRVEDACLIGMQATILDDAVIGAASIVRARALVTQETVIPPSSLVQVAPSRVVRKLTEDDESRHRAMAVNYVRLQQNYLR